jgi:hypothetical protein
MVSSTISDHNIVMLKVENFLDIKFSKRNIPKKKVFTYDNMTDAHWTKFSEKTDALINSCSLRTLKNDTPFTQSNLNLYWDLLQECIMKAADKTIPSRLSKGHHHLNRSHLLSKLYKNIRFLYKFKKLVKSIISVSLPSTNWPVMADRFYNLLSEFGFNFVRLPTSPQIFLIRSLTTYINQLLAATLVKAKLHEHEHKLKAIQQAIDKRLENYSTSPSNMIDSVLERSKKTIILDRCFDNSSSSRDLLTDEKQVKTEVAHHFQMAAGSSHENVIIDDDWISSYQPINGIDVSVYNDLMLPPSADEWYNIISSLPDGKAPGPSKVSNEMLKHLGDTSRRILWYIICGCLRLSSLPHRWNHAFIYPIPKPKPWEYDLNNTRPITLLECPRKALIKLLNRRLSSILVKHNILKGLNFAGLPFKSTFKPLHIIDNVIYDAKHNKKDLWILLQDMSKAYD